MSFHVYTTWLIYVISPLCFYMLPCLYFSVSYLVTTQERIWLCDSKFEFFMVFFWFTSIHFLPLTPCLPWVVGCWCSFTGGSNPYFAVTITRKYRVFVNFSPLPNIVRLYIVLTQYITYFIRKESHFYIRFENLW